MKQLQFLITRIGFALFLGWSLMVYVVRHTILGALMLLVIVPSSIIALTVFYPYSAPEIESSATTALHVPGGASFRQIADSLERKELLKHRNLFLVLGKVTGKERNVRAGLFEIPEGLTTWQLLNYIEFAPTSQFKVTFPEGATSFQMGSIVEARLGLDSTKFVNLVHDSVFAHSIIPGATSLEGYLLPETYQFEWKTPEQAIIRYLVEQTRKILAPDSIRGRMKTMGLTELEVLTLASIIEGEALVDSERTTISSLYHNRLRLQWPLQADPTIQYVLPGPPRRLLTKDLKFDSPYNTYLYRGLPPGPINNPGQSSILAALYPISSPFLYMVAFGDGTHKFSRTLKEHNYWHQRFNQVRRRERQKQRRSGAR